MPRPKGSFKTPSLTLHKPSGRARVCIDGKDQYCGVYGTLEAQQKYERLIAERVLRGKQTATAEPAAVTSSGPTVSQVIAALLAARPGLLPQTRRHPDERGRHAPSSATAAAAHLRCNAGSRVRAAGAEGAARRDA